MAFAIRDLLYFDVEKASSILSQFEGGLRESLATTTDVSKDRKLGASLGVAGVAEISAGLGSGSKASILETKTLHHDLLARVEEDLSESGLLVDLGRSLTSGDPSPEEIHAAIGEVPYLYAAGWSVIEDYRRITAISENYNDLVAFVSSSSVDQVRQSEEYLALQSEFEEAKASVRRTKDRNQKAVILGNVKTLERQIEDLLSAATPSVEEQILEGIRLWIRVFVQNRINFRIYPFENCPSFQILCNLKRDCFVDQDLEHVLYGYGTRPNVPLGVIGLVTSRPKPGGATFNPLAEFAAIAEKDPSIVLEESFRSMFTAIEEMEAMMRFSRYPNVTVHPIAVFRQFTPSNNNRKAPAT